jgi:transketolase
MSEPARGEVGHDRPDRQEPGNQVEQASVFGWARYVGATGRSVGMRSFGASAPLKDLQREIGFTAERVVAEAKAQLGSALK